MIILDDQILKTKQDIEEAKTFLKNEAEKINKTEYYPLLRDLLDDCYSGDQKLQEFVTKKISRDLTSFVIVPTKPEHLNEFNFILSSNDGRSIKKKEEKLYQKYAHECFKDIQAFETRVIAFEEKKQKLYI